MYKTNFKNSKLLIFVLKLLLFLHPDNKDDIYKKMEEYFSINNDNYTKLIKYYKKIGGIIIM